MNDKEMFILIQFLTIVFISPNDDQHTKDKNEINNTPCLCTFYKPGVLWIIFCPRVLPI